MSRTVYHQPLPGCFAVPSGLARQRRGQMDRQNRPRESKTMPDQSPPSPAHTEEERARAPRSWETLKVAYDEFSRDNGGLMAAAICFYVLLSVMPALLLAVSIAGF